MLSIQACSFCILPRFAAMHQLLQRVKNELNIVVFVVVYLSFLLDNVLLTVVVPIIPDYLFYNDINITTSKNPENVNYIAGLTSLSPLQRKYEALEKDNGPLGALLASKAFVQLAFTPFVGYLTGRFGCNVPLLFGSCCMLLASFLYAYGHSYGVLVLARALHGGSSAAISVSGMCLLAQTVPKEDRFRLMPLAFGGIALGVLIGYPFGGAAYQLLGKSAPFLLIAFFISMNIALQWTYLEEPPKIPEEDGEDDKNTTTFDDWEQIVKDKHVLIATGAICICTSSMAILEPCIPMWLLAKLDPPPSRWELGAVFIPDSVGYFVGAHFTGLLPVQPWRSALSAMVVTGLSCCFIPLTTTLRQLALPHFFLGLGVGAVDATLVPLLAHLVENRGGNRYGPVYSLQQIAVCLAYSLGPLIGGEAVQSVGFPWLIRLTGFLNVMFCPLISELENIMTMKNLLQKNGLPSYSSIKDFHITP